MTFLLIRELFDRDYGRHEHISSTFDFLDHHMTVNVVKMRIRVDLGAADYTGPVNDAGRPHGLGSFKVVDDANECYTYEGHFNNGKCEGLGKLSSNDGRIWQGEYKENKLNGFVKVVLLRCDLSHSFQWTNANEGVLEGIFKDEKHHGLGTVLLRLF